MNDLTTFDFQNHAVRTLVIDGAPYWVAKDVAEVLGYTNPSKAIGDHCKGVTKRYPLQTAGGVQEMRVIGESDLYRLIAHSNLPAAEAFESWIYEEVLPTIRRTGGYIKATEDETPEVIMARGLLVAKDTIDRLQARIEGQEAQIEEMKPKVLFADAVASSDTTFLVREIAKLMKQGGLDTGEKRLFEELRNRGFLIKQGSDRNLPTQKAMDMGLFVVKQTPFIKPDGSVRVTKTPKVTAKGQVYFVNLFLKELREKEEAA